ncbi:MAG: hypothetical protein ACI843_001169 [Psychrobacter glaciei]|jgi:hypothetical protein
MSNEYQPKFNRMSLNVLMLASAALIVIFGQSARQMDYKPLPPAPKLDISIWHADSGAKVWYSPYFSETLEIQLWYQAGFAYDDAFTGRANMLAQLLKFESQTMKLPMEVSLDQDFIKFTLHLSTDPVKMKSQIEQSVALLYRPKLPNQAIKKLVKINAQTLPTLSDELWQQTYAGHAYGNIKQNNLASAASFTRAQLQKYQQAYIHPQRLHASIVGDISERGAQIIMESLLPASKYKSPSYSSIASKSIGTVSNHQQLMVVWPGEYINDFIESNDPQTLKNGTIKKAAKSQEEMAKQQLQTHVDKQMTVQLLKAIHGDSVKWQPGKYNSTLVIRQPDQLKHAVQDQIDSDMIAHNTRQLAKKWLEMVNNASGLSQYLVELNAYRLPVNQLRKDLSVLDGWDDDNWETASETLLPWLYQD